MTFEATNGAASVAEEVRLLESALVPTGFYRWQRRLLEECLLTGVVPRAIDVATGLGKTKVMAAWLIARAVGAHLPRRLVYVVDRRVVVDQASAEAEVLVQRLSTALGDANIPQAIRDGWRVNLGLGSDGDLPVSTLRGQHVDNRRWIDRPHGTAIIVGTVDMLGSRLLFSGYGVSRGMRPVHAALLGCDAYFVLDESHLVPPFEKLLEQVGEMTNADRENAPDRCIPPFALSALSATGRALSDVTTFRLNEDDLREPVVQARITAEKRLWLQPRVDVKDLAAALEERAWEAAGTNRRVLVFSNSRKIAQDVESRLRKRAQGEYGGRAVTALLVGERRLRERSIEYSAEGSVLRQFSPGAQGRETPLFLVATSAGEVGVDLDADDIVCDLVAWERMVQRFGRVNRRPEPGKATISIIPSVSEKDAEDEVALERLAALQSPFESDHWPVAADGSRDASPLALQQLKASIGALLDRATTPSPYYPRLERPTLEAWALTSLRDHPGRPVVTPWLRGWDAQRPQTTILWRTRFPLRKNWSDEFPSGRGADIYRSAERKTIESDIERFFDAAPPHATETIDAPTDRIAELIKKRVESWVESSDANSEARPSHEPGVIVLTSANDLDKILTIKMIRDLNVDRISREIAERTVIVDARFGGLAATGLIDIKESEPPITMDGDERWWEGTDIKPPLRIQWGRWQRPSGPWRFDGFRWCLDPDDAASPQLWVEVRRDRESAAGDQAVTRRAQALAEHHEWTRSEAERIADVVAPSKRALLALAAGFHDTGKNRELWQDAMNAESGGRPYAKTIGGATPSALGGYRHEFGSLIDALSDRDILALDERDRELALHLIASHHGYTRPTVKPFDPHSPPRMSADIALAASRRCTSLQRAWGPWGLAWFESLLRSADWSASRRVNEGG